MYLLTELGRVGREDIWLEVMPYGPSCVVQKREEGEGLVNKWSVSKGARVNWTTNDSRYFMNERKRAKKSFNHYTNNCTEAVKTNNPNIAVEI